MCWIVASKMLLVSVKQGVFSFEKRLYLENILQVQSAAASKIKIFSNLIEILKSKKTIEKRVKKLQYPEINAFYTTVPS